MNNKTNPDNSSKCSPADCTFCEGCSENAVSLQEHHSIRITLDDDTEKECSILSVFSVKESEYIALLPLDENGQSTDGEVYLYRFSLTESGDPVLSNIEDDDEYAAAADAFNVLFERAAAEENG